jgi:hypothetical protein
MRSSPSASCSSPPCHPRPSSWGQPWQIASMVSWPWLLLRLGSRTRRTWTIAFGRRKVYIYESEIIMPPGAKVKRGSEGLGGFFECGTRQSMTGVMIWLALRVPPWCRILQNKNSAVPILHIFYTNRPSFYTRLISRRTPASFSGYASVGFRTPTPPPFRLGISRNQQREAMSFTATRTK